MKATACITLSDTKYEPVVLLCHCVGHVLNDDVIVQIQRRYTCARKDSIITLHSFVHSCCRIVCMIGNAIHTMSRKKVVAICRSIDGVSRQGIKGFKPPLRIQTCFFRIMHRVAQNVSHYQIIKIV